MSSDDKNFFKNEMVNCADFEVILVSKIMESPQFS